MRAAARSLEVLTAPVNVVWEDWTQACHADFEANLTPSAIADLPEDTTRGLVDMPQVVAALQRHLPADTVITNGAGNFASWVHRYFRYTGLASGHKTQLAPTNGAMGYGVPAGIAAAITTGRLAFTIAGDGDFLMNGQELATAVQYGAKTVIVLLNNGMFGTIRMHQEREYPQHVAGTHLQNPDFAALARAYGYAGVSIRRTADFEAELLAALARPNGTLIEVVLEPELISTRGTLSAMTASALQQGR
jgi:acetolactate synthase-1/2/3 large subunit